MTRPMALLAASVAVFWMTASGRAADTPLQSAALAWERRGLRRRPDDLSPGPRFAAGRLGAGGNRPPDRRTLPHDRAHGGWRVPRIFARRPGGSVRNRPGRRARHPSVPVDGRSRPGIELQGRSAAFSPDGSKLAYLKLAPSAELTAAQAAVDDAPPAERALRQAALTQLIAANSTLVVRDLASGREIDTGYKRSAQGVASHGR